MYIKANGPVSKKKSRIKTMTPYDNIIGMKEAKHTYIYKQTQSGIYLNVDFLVINYVLLCTS